MSNLNNQIEQCKKDIELLTKQLKILEAEESKCFPFPRNGDVVQCGDNKRIIIVNNGTVSDWKSYGIYGVVVDGWVEKLYKNGEYKVLYNVFDKE